MRKVENFSWTIFVFDFDYETRVDLLVLDLADEALLWEVPLRKITSLKGRRSDGCESGAGFRPIKDSIFANILDILDNQQEFICTGTLSLNQVGRMSIVRSGNSKIGIN